MGVKAVKSLKPECFIKSRAITKIPLITSDRNTVRTKESIFLRADLAVIVARAANVAESMANKMEVFIIKLFTAVYLIGFLKFLVDSAGLEPATFPMRRGRSSQLSYEPTVIFYHCYVWLCMPR